VAFDDPREAEQLVLDLAQMIFRLRDLEQRLRPRLDAVGHDQLLPDTWSMKLSTSWRFVSESRFRSTMRPARSIDNDATSVRSCAIAWLRWFTMSAWARARMSFASCSARAIRSTRTVS